MPFLKLGLKCTIAAYPSFSIIDEQENFFHPGHVDSAFFDHIDCKSKANRIGVSGSICSGSLKVQKFAKTEKICPLWRS
eukprot:759627-Hanusia_phi.AAC.3